MAFGVYEIVFHTDHGDMIYIGSTAVGFDKRLRQHKSSMNLGKHKNKKLQNHFNKYREFEFKIIEECNDPKIVTIREQWYIEHTDSNSLINLGPAFPSTSFGKRRSESANQKIREANIGRRTSELTKRKISKSKLGKKLSEAHRQKIRDGLIATFTSKEFEDHRRRCRVRIMVDQAERDMIRGAADNQVYGGVVSKLIRAILHKKLDPENH